MHSATVVADRKLVLILMCGEALVNEIHCHPGSYYIFIQLPPVLKIGQTRVGTGPPSLLWSAPLGGTG